MALQLRAMLTLVRWLGPWTNQERAPTQVRSVVQQVRNTGEPDLRTRVFIPTDRPAIGALFVVPGIHHQGPDDPRLARFASVLAAAGIVTCTPYIPALMDLRLHKDALRHTERCLLHFAASEHIPDDARPGIFSISAGSILALHAAASADTRSLIGPVTLFGGFSDWSEALRFALTGDVPGGGKIAHDPLNQPVVFMNLADTLPGMPADPTPLVEAWREFVHATWERPEMAHPDAHGPVADRIAARFDGETRTLFLQGCSVRPGGLHRIESALRVGGADTDWLDPTPYLQQIRVPVTVVHGMDDVVIPWSQADKLAHALGPRCAGTVVTGLVHHTGVTRIWTLIKRLPLLPLELWRSLAIPRAMLASATSPHPHSSPQLDEVRPST